LPNGSYFLTIIEKNQTRNKNFWCWFWKFTRLQRSNIRFKKSI
jgi:hypothetical protein